MNLRHNTRSARRAFTLVEALVVIAIIAALASLMLPALAKSKGRAQGISCLNNSRQIAIAFTSYMLDSHEVIPLQRWAPGPYYNSRGFRCGAEWSNTPAILLNTHLKAPITFTCPTKRRGLTYLSEPGQFDPSITGFLSYGFNYLGVFGRLGSMTPPERVSEITRPADTVLMAEVFGSNDPRRTGRNDTGDAAWLNSSWALGSYPGSRMSVSDQNFKFQAQMKKHNRRVMVTFLDGRSSGLKPSQLYWGQFYGRFGGNTPRIYAPWDSPVSDSRLDGLETTP